MKNHMQGFSLNTNTLLLIVVGLLALGYFGVISYPGASGRALGGGSGGVTVLPSTQNIYVSSSDYALAATAVGSNSDIFIVSDGSLLKSQLASGTAQAVPANTRLRIFTNASGYFNAETFVETGTQSTLNVPVKLADDTTATIAIYNSGSYTTNALAAQQAFSANDQYTLRVDVTGATNDYLANPTISKVRFALLFTTPANWAYSSTSDTFMEYNGAKCPTVATPVTGGNRQIAWECPILNGGTGTTPNSYFLTLKASAAGGAAANTTLSFWGVDIYKNTQTALTEMGVEDNTGAKLHTETNATIFTS
jgi:hypothetical protein